jgi:hypothetical protein
MVRRFTSLKQFPVETRRILRDLKNARAAHEAARPLGSGEPGLAEILTRYNEIGLEGLTDRSRRPYRNANQLPFQIETRIVRLKQDKPSWGAPKIGERLARLYPDVHTPAISIVHAVLDRHGQDIVVTSLDGNPHACRTGTFVFHLQRGHHRRCTVAVPFQGAGVNLKI